MGIAVNGSNLWRGQPVMQPGGLPFPARTPKTEASSREVVRCPQCSLVQFRTTSDLCRRCAQPLRSQIPEPAIAATPAKPPATASSSLPDDVSAIADEPRNRGERNRKIAMGSRVQSWRQQRGLTQGRLARRLGVPRTYLSRIENNHLLPGPMMVPKIASALGLQVSDLLPARADRNARLHVAGDEIMAGLLQRFAQLTPSGMAAILSRARGMMAAGVNPPPATGAPEGLQRGTGRALAGALRK